MLMELKVKPLEWKQDRFENWIAHGVNCAYKLSKQVESDDYYCQITTIHNNKFEESFYDSDISQMKLWCETHHKNTVIRHFNNSINFYTDNNITFI